MEFLKTLRLERDGDRVRLITRGGYNWTDRYPLAPSLSPRSVAGLQSFLR